MSPTPPGGIAATPDGCATDRPEAVPDEAVPPQRTGPEPLPRRVRGASGVTKADEESEPVDEATLHRLLTSLRDF